jgi:hypothetical protein
MQTIQPYVGQGKQHPTLLSVVVSAELSTEEITHVKDEESGKQSAHDVDEPLMLIFDVLMSL